MENSKIKQPLSINNIEWKNENLHEYATKALMIPKEYFGDGCKICKHNIQGEKAARWCRENCIRGDKFESA